MSYTLRNKDGSIFKVLADQEVNGDYSVTFTGRQVNSYGEIQQDNFLWLMSNFADSQQPVNGVPGQLWYDTQSQCLKVCKKKTSDIATSDGDWVKLQTSEVATETPEGSSEGDIFYDPENQKVYVVYENDDGSKEKLLVGPNSSSNEISVRLTGQEKSTSRRKTSIIAVLDNEHIGHTFDRKTLTFTFDSTIIAKSNTNPKKHYGVWRIEGLACRINDKFTVIGSNVSQSFDVTSDWNKESEFVKVTADDSNGITFTYSAFPNTDSDDTEVISWSNNTKIIINDEVVDNV